MPSKKADSSASRADMTFASFFHSETEADLVNQVEWAQEKLGFSDAFFSALLRIDENGFSRWRNGRGSLARAKQEDLREFWEAVRHILSFLNFNLDLVLAMLEHVEDRSKRAARLPYDPPWIGTSIRSYLESTGSDGIHNVNQWVQSVRFADLY